MYKFLTAVFLLTITSLSFAMDITSLDPNIEMKQIVRTKLWYQGIEITRAEDSQEQIAINNNSLKPSEELLVALDKLDKF